MNTPEHVKKLGRIVDSHIPQGAVVETYVYGALAIGAALSYRKKDKAPFVSASQGLAATIFSNAVGSVVAHRMAAHKSVRFKRPGLIAMRTANALFAGAIPDSFAATHKAHHRHADDPEDPHSPNILGRWYVFRHIASLVNKHASEHPELVEKERADPSVRRWPIDHDLITPAGVVGLHMMAGHVLKQPIRYRVASAFIQAGGMYVVRAAFTGDSHPNGHPNDFNLTPLSSLVMGGETEHAHHHDDPKDPRHSKYDPGYVIIRALEMVGQAETRDRPPAVMAT